MKSLIEDPDCVVRFPFNSLDLEINKKGKFNTTMSFKPSKLHLQKRLFPVRDFGEAEFKFKLRLSLTSFRSHNKGDLDSLVLLPLHHSPLFSYNLFSYKDEPFR